MVKTIIKKVLNKFRKVVKIPIYIPVMNGNLLKDRIVMVTGGTSGIGYAIAEGCLRNGAKVIITGRSKERLQKACKSLCKNVENLNQDYIKNVVMDLQDTKNIENIFKNIIEAFPEKRIDILVNNAGIMQGNHIGNTDIESFENVINTNLKGTYFLSQIFSNYLIQEDIKGNILNISSSSGIRPAVSPYMVSKWGEVGLTLGLAKKLIPYGIVVNGIAPGPTATKMLNQNTENIIHSSSPAGRYSMPEEIANMAVFLVSDMGRMVVGDTVYMTGGSANLTIDDMNY